MSMRRHQDKEHEKLPCSQCDDEFVAPDQLHAHITRFHDPSRPFVCEFPGCNKRFRLSSILEKHQRTFRHFVGPAAAGAGGGPIRVVRGRVARAGRARGRGAAERGARGRGARGTRGRGGA